MKFTTLLTTTFAVLHAATAQPTQQQQQFQVRQTHEVPAEEKRTTTASGSGKMTYYTPGLGACGVTNDDTDMIVAVSPSVYGSYANPNSSPMCQKTMTITCNSKTVKAAVKDRCAGCGTKDIDVSPAVFEACGDLSAGVMTVSWTTN